MLELGLPRSSLRYQVQPSNDDALRLAMIRLAERYGWYDYRKVTPPLRMEGWRLNHSWKDQKMIRWTIFPEQR